MGSQTPHRPAPSGQEGAQDARPDLRHHLRLGHQPLLGAHDVARPVVQRLRPRPRRRRPPRPAVHLRRARRVRALALQPVAVQVQSPRQQVPPVHCLVLHDHRLWLHGHRGEGQHR